eukprot:2475762-Rhodomonas_salina.1
MPSLHRLRQLFCCLRLPTTSRVSRVCCAGLRIPASQAHAALRRDWVFSQATQCHVQEKRSTSQHPRFPSLNSGWPAVLMPHLVTTQPRLLQSESRYLGAAHVALALTCVYIEELRRCSLGIGALLLVLDVGRSRVLLGHRVLLSRPNTPRVSITRARTLNPEP